MKKLLACMLALVMTLSLAACGGKQAPGGSGAADGPKPAGERCMERRWGSAAGFCEKLIETAGEYPKGVRQNHENNCLPYTDKSAENHF